jgi:hypothetical protein
MKYGFIPVNDRGFIDKQTNKIHYNPWVKKISVSNRPLKTVCGQKNNGNESHIKDEVTCAVCKGIMEENERLNSMTIEELDNREYLEWGHEYDKPKTARDIKREKEKFAEFLRDAFGPSYPGEDLYLTDGMYLTPDNEIVDHS